VENSNDFFTTWFLLAIFEGRDPVVSFFHHHSKVATWGRDEKNYCSQVGYIWNMVIWIVNDKESWTTLLYSGYNHL
jgi:hypothetical protein